MLGLLRKESINFPYQHLLYTFVQLNRVFPEVDHSGNDERIV